MKLILDTNAWYNLPKDQALQDAVKGHALAPNMMNISELCQTRNMVKKPDEVREAMRAMHPHNHNAILQTPFSYLAALNGCDWEQPDLNVRDVIKFVETISRGGIIDKDKEKEYLAMVENMDSQMAPFCEWMNDKAADIRQVVKPEKKKHREKDTILLTAQFLNFAVSSVSKDKCDLLGLDTGRIELLVGTLDTFFKNLELTGMKITPNDFPDFLMLAYVQPGDKYFTYEKKWIRMIKEAGLEKYLLQV